MQISQEAIILQKFHEYKKVISIENDASIVTILQLQYYTFYELCQFLNLCLFFLEQSFVSEFENIYDNLSDIFSCAYI